MLPFLESLRISGRGSGEKENSPRLFSFVGPGRVCELFRTIGEFADWGFFPLGLFSEVLRRDFAGSGPVKFLPAFGVLRGEGERRRRLEL